MTTPDPAPTHDHETSAERDYTVSVTNTFRAASPEAAVRQMVEWLLDNAAQTGYRVTPEGFDQYEFIDADDAL